MHGASTLWWHEWACGCSRMRNSTALPGWGAVQRKTIPTASGGPIRLIFQFREGAARTVRAAHGMRQSRRRALGGEYGRGWSGIDGGSLKRAVPASALPYRDETFNKAEYAYQLPVGAGPVLSFRAKTLGVGSAACGPRPLNQYMVYSDPIVFSYVLRPVPAGAREMAALAREPALLRVAPVEINRDKTGKVWLNFTTPGATISYSIDDGEMKPYTEPFRLKDGKLTIKATARDTYR